MTLPVGILAGGVARRLRPITETIPKALVEVAGQPFAEHQLDWLRRQGVDRVVFLVGYRGDMIRDTLGNGSRWGLTIEYVFDGPVLLGTGGAIRRIPSAGSGGGGMSKPGSNPSLSSPVAWSLPHPNANTIPRSAA